MKNSAKVPQQKRVTVIFPQKNKMTITEKTSMKTLLVIVNILLFYYPSCLF